MTGSVYKKGPYEVEGTEEEVWQDGKEVSRYGSRKGNKLGR